MEFVACLTLRGPDLVASISSVPNCGSGSQEWLFKGPTVCLVTMALLQSIVTQNMCFYGHNVDHCHVPSSSVAEQLKMNCFDDLFVPTDAVQFSISVFICTVHASLWIE